MYIRVSLQDCDTYGIYVCSHSLNMHVHLSSEARPKFWPDTSAKTKICVQAVKALARLHKVQGSQVEVSISEL